MISFSKLGKQGRFGNQLFQYAFLRTQAERLKTQFYCPDWIGDRVFLLGDKDERTGPFKADHFYAESDSVHGFHTDTLDIQDGTEISGFFQSDTYFSRDDVTRWFSFNEELFSDIHKKYRDIDFSKSIAIHVRLGDYLQPTTQFYVPRKSYFKNALALFDQKQTVLVFSDDVNLAKKYLNFISGNVIFVEGNADYEDFYLMTQCKNIICSASSFSWWAAYLNKFHDKKVIVPKYWFLPGSKMTNPDIFVEGWIKVASTRWYDHRLIKGIPIKIRKVYNKLMKKEYVYK